MQDNDLQLTYVVLPNPVPLKKWFGIKQTLIELGVENNVQPRFKSQMLQGLMCDRPEVAVLIKLALSQ